MYVCIYIYIYIHTCIHTYIHTYIHTHNIYIYIYQGEGEAFKGWSRTVLLTKENNTIWATFTRSIQKMVQDCFDKKEQHNLGHFLLEAFKR